jgi:hypothetical protein
MCEPFSLIRARLLSQHCRDVIVFRLSSGLATLKTPFWEATNGIPKA